MKFLNMKHFFSSILILFSVLCFSQTDVFDGSFEELKKTATKERKAYFIDFSTSWCGYCRKFEREVMSDSSFFSLINQQFVFAKIDGDVEKELVAKYRVTGYPTFLIFDYKGEEIKRFNGYVDAASFVKSLNYLGYKLEDYSVISLEEYEVEKAKQLSQFESPNEVKILKEKVIEIGRTNDLLAKEDLVFDFPNDEKFIEFYYDYSTKGFNIKKLEDAFAKGIIDGNTTHGLLVRELLVGKRKVEESFLSLINTLLLSSPDDYYLLDTKAYIYFQLGENRDGLQVAKRAKKVAVKSKRDYSATEFLLILE